MGGTYSFPKYIEVIKEVTGKKGYGNKDISKRPNLYGDDSIENRTYRTKFRLEARLVPGKGKRAIGYIVKNITEQNIILGDLAIGAGMAVPVYLADLSRMETSEVLRFTFINAKIVGLEGPDKYIVRAIPGNKIPEIIV